MSKYQPARRSRKSRRLSLKRRQATSQQETSLTPPVELPLVIQQAKDAPGLMSPAGALYLQQTMGNRATSRLLLERDGTRPIPAIQTNMNGGVVFRDKAGDDVSAVSGVMKPQQGTGKADAPGLKCDPDVNPNDPGCQLTAGQRGWLRSEVGDRINAGFTNFLIACEHQSDKLKAALAKETALLDMMLGVAFGFGIGKLVGLTLNGIDKIPAGAPDWIQGAGVRILDKPDLVKKPLDALGNLVRKKVKERYPKNAIDFVNKIQNEASLWAQDARGQIPGYTDDELLSAYVTWDAAYTKIDAYEKALDDLVKRFREVMMAGELDPRMPMPGGSMSGSYRSWSNRAVWVHVYPGQRALAMMLVFEEKTDDPRYGKVEKEYFFRSWVLPDMQAWAIAKTEHRYGPIDVIGPNDYKNYVPGMAR